MFVEYVHIRIMLRTKKGPLPLEALTRKEGKKLGKKQEKDFVYLMVFLD